MKKLKLGVVAVFVILGLSLAGCSNPAATDLRNSGNNTSNLDLVKSLIGGTSFASEIGFASTVSTSTERVWQVTKESEWVPPQPVESSWVAPQPVEDSLVPPQPIEDSWVPAVPPVWVDDPEAVKVINAYMANGVQYTGTSATKPVTVDLQGNGVVYGSITLVQITTTGSSKQVSGKVSLKPEFDKIQMAEVAVYSSLDKAPPSMDNPGTLLFTSDQAEIVATVSNPTDYIYAVVKLEEHNGYWTEEIPGYFAEYTKEYYAEYTEGYYAEYTDEYWTEEEGYWVEPGDPIISDTEKTLSLGYDLQTAKIVENSGINFGDVTIVDNKDGTLTVRFTFVPGFAELVDSISCGIGADDPVEVADFTRTFAYNSGDAVTINTLLQF